MASLAHGVFAGAVPSTQTGWQVFPAQSRLSTQDWPAFGPMAQLPTARATRRIVYAASAEPKSVTTSCGFPPASDSTISALPSRADELTT